MLKDFKLATLAFLALLAIPLTVEMSQNMYTTTPRAESQTLSAVITPSDSCKTGLNTFAVQEPCPEGYRYAKYSCYDGTTGMLGGATSCKSSAIWTTTAREICQGKSSCSLVPSVTPTVTVAVCKRGLNSYAFENDCTIPGYTARGYRKMSYSCYDGTKGTFTMKSCQIGENLIKSATQICQTYDTSCSAPTPTKPAVSPTVTKAVKFDTF